VLNGSRIWAAIYFVAFLLCVPVANFLILHVGTKCVPDGPCLVPVGFGLMAPSGVLVVGLALVLRDLVYETSGWRGAFAAIGLGALASAFFAPATLVVASVSAFLVSESLDSGAYAWARRYSIALAVLVSGVVGSVVDSVVFLYVAFGDLTYVYGQVLAKAYATVAVSGLFFTLRR
jgi:queuosine precursor transporter